MADSEQLRILKEEGVQAWNEWREQRPEALLSEPYLGQPRFSEANLRGADFRGVNLKGANLTEAHLRWAYLRDADLSGAYLREADLSAADLRHADLSGANLWNANLSGADLREADLRKAHLSVADLIGANLWNANLSGADLGEADLRRANLSGANLRWAYLREADLGEANLIGANLNDADLNDADLTGCHIFGVSAWQLKLSEGTKQQNLVITRPGETQITVDEIEVAQFLYLLLHNEKLRKVIDTITSKVVLILGRFSAERKAVLDAMREALRKRDLLPVIFEFAIPASRDVTKTVKVLAGLARFVIADITDATEVQAELHGIIRDFPSLPVQPILLCGQSEFASVQNLRKFPWLLPSFEYATTEHLLNNLERCVVAPAEAKVLELQGRKPTAS
jgi:uncharacterized protein YjbI with pentapeptide repeats